MPIHHCPHCEMAIGGDGGSSSRPYPPRPLVCPFCRLLIAAGRARTAISSPRSGTAAGALANAARRQAAEPADPLRVVADLRLAADRVGCPVARLRMLDYQAQTEADPALVGLDGVLAAYPSWKLARATAATAESAPPDETGAAPAPAPPGLPQAGA